MKYSEWLASVPKEITDDVLWRVEVYRLALFACELAWHDASKLIGDRRTVGLSGQLYDAVGSIGSNVAEGYSRRSGRDQARFYEYSLGSAREARDRYYQGRHILGKQVIAPRLGLHARIIRLLLKMIPTQRGYKLEDEKGVYGSVPNDLLDDIRTRMNRNGKTPARSDFPTDRSDQRIDRPSCLHHPFAALADDSNLEVEHGNSSRPTGCHIRISPRAFPGRRIQQRIPVGHAWCEKSVGGVYPLDVWVPPRFSCFLCKDFIRNGPMP